MDNQLLLIKQTLIEYIQYKTNEMKDNKPNIANIWQNYLNLYVDNLFNNIQKLDDLNQIINVDLSRQNIEFLLIYSMLNNHNYV